MLEEEVTATAFMENMKRNTVFVMEEQAWGGMRTNQSESFSLTALSTEMGGKGVSVKILLCLIL